MDFRHTPRELFWKLIFMWVRLNRCGHLSTTQTLAPFPTTKDSFMGKDKRKEKTPENSWVKVSSTGNGNGKVKEDIEKNTPELMIQGQSLTNSHCRLTPHQLPRNRLLTYLIPLFPLFYSWAWHCKAWKISLVSLGHTPICVLSLPLTHPNLFTEWEENAFMLQKCCSAVSEMLACYHRSTTGAPQSCYGENDLHPSQT